MPALLEERLVRNHGPFPYIQSEGCWRPLRDVSFKRVAPLQPLGPCPPPADDDQVQALLRHKLQLELQQLQRGRGRQEGRLPEPEPSPSSPHPEPHPEPQQRDPLSSPLWAASLSPWDRLNTHHTLTSVRRHAQLVRPLEPRDKLDLTLSAAYQHDCSLWAREQDVCVQPETLGCASWRVLRNLRARPREQPPAREHPLLQAGVDSRLSVHSVKLAISGNHMAQTNAGFSRKVDGTFYS